MDRRKGRASAVAGGRQGSLIASRAAPTLATRQQAMEPSPSTPTPGSDVVFISDDDEDLVQLEQDEWQADSTAAASSVVQHAGQIQLQLSLCLVAAIALPALAALISLAWRRYGDTIYAQQTGAAERKKER